MPEHEDGEVRLYPIRLSDEFVEGLARIWSERVLDHIKLLIKLLPANPELGSPHVRQSLKKHYGEGLHKLTASSYIIVYRFDGEVVDVLAVVYGPNVR